MNMQATARKSALDVIFDVDSRCEAGLDRQHPAVADRVAHLERVDFVDQVGALLLDPGLQLFNLLKGEEVFLPIAKSTRRIVKRNCKRFLLKPIRVA